MESADREECIIISNDDDDDETEDPLESSVLLIEHSEDFPLKEKEAGEVVDEECEVIVTFCKRAKLMPHARYDCTINPFERAECETSHPLGRNAKTCGECYCYICNKHAEECKDWVTPSLCHCNAHNKSKYWKDQWNFALTGGLVTFNLNLSEIDGDVQRGGSEVQEGQDDETVLTVFPVEDAPETSPESCGPLHMAEPTDDGLGESDCELVWSSHTADNGNLLQKFTHDISVEYKKYQSGESISSNCHKCLCQQNLDPGQCDACGLLPQPVKYRYTSVFDLVTNFLNQAEQEKPKAETVMLLGAAKEILLHKHPHPSTQNVDLSATFTKRVTHLMDRITRRLQRLLILNDFPKPLYKKFIQFYRSIPFPAHCQRFINSLDFMTWDHGLLTSILKGQNATGQRSYRGKKETLCEVVPVGEARIERMENRQQYKELIRYLKVVKCSDFQWLNKQRDRIPFYHFKSGNSTAAAQAFFSIFPKSCCLACRISPSQFKILLKIFRTGQVPSGNELEDPAPWLPLGAPLKFPVLIKQTFRIIFSNLSLYKNPQCWSFLITAFSSHCILGEDGCLIPLTVKEPPPEFQQIVFKASCYIVGELATKNRSNIFIAEAFELELEAGLIFVVEAIRQMLLHNFRSLTSFLEIVLAFGGNVWCLKLLLESLAPHEEVLRTIAGLTITDLHSRKVEILALCNRFGSWYVCELLYLFLASRDRNLPSVGIIIIDIIKENLHECSWAKAVGEFLQNTKRHFSWVSPDVSSFIAASQALP